MSLYKRATLKGTLGDSDIWMAGFALASEELPVDLAQRVQSSVKDDLEGMWGGGVAWLGVRIDEIDVDTGAVLDSYEQLYTDGFAEGGGGNMLPPEVAVCVTIESAGPSNRKGRFYLPPPTVARCGVNGRIEHTWRDSLAANLFQLFQTNLGEANPPARLSVYSRKDRELYVGTAISVGDVFDAQRRRRNKMVEQRTRYVIA